MTSRLVPSIGCAGLIAVAALSLAARTQAAGGGTVEKIKVHGTALEGNLEGDSADRDVMVYLPPSYATERSRRYPVLFLLHGFTDDTDHWWGVVPHFVSVPSVHGQGAREWHGQGHDPGHAECVYALLRQHVFELRDDRRLGAIHRS